MSTTRLQPLVLNVDGSVGPLDDETRLPLTDWQETVRFGCTTGRYAAFRKAVEAQFEHSWRRPGQLGNPDLGEGSPPGVTATARAL